MKKIMSILFTTIIIIVIIAYVRYNSYKIEYSNILKENIEYEQYIDKEIYGIELATIINKTIDKNTNNNVKKDDNGNYVANEKNSIKIEVYMKDNEKTYIMETFYNAGMDQFIQYYGNIKFKCSKIEYHKSTNRIKYILFEQIITS